MLTIGIFCLMNAWPHFLFGPGQDALDATVEFGRSDFNKSTAKQHKELCQTGGNYIHQ